MKIILSFGLYKVIPQIDPNAFTKSVAKVQENLKLSEVVGQLGTTVAQHANSPTLVPSPEQCFYPWKNTNKGDYMISIVDITGQKDYKCSFQEQERYNYFGKRRLSYNHFEYFFR